MNNPDNIHNLIDKHADTDLRSHDAQIALAIKMRLSDLQKHKPGSRLPGAANLLDRIQNESRLRGLALPNEQLISEPHLRRFLPKTLEGNEVTYADLDDVEPFMRSYLVRLAAVKSIFNLERRLTAAEANAARRVYYEFNDPYGEIVDLIPQFAIAHELAERAEQKPKSVHIADIDEYFAIAPWKSEANKKLFETAINYGKAIPPQLRLICPFVPATEPPPNIVGGPLINPFSKYRLQIGAHVHLGMPYALNYSTPIGSGRNPKNFGYMLLTWDSYNLRDESPKECQDSCRWTSAAISAIRDDSSKSVDKTDSEETSTNTRLPKPEDSHDQR